MLYVVWEYNIIYIYQLKNNHGDFFINNDNPLTPPRGRAPEKQGYYEFGGFPVSQVLEPLGAHGGFAGFAGFASLSSCIP